MSNFSRFLESLKERTKNYGFWVSLFALIPLVVQTFGDVSILPHNYEDLTNTILSLIVALGVANNPTTGKWYTTPCEKDHEHSESCMPQPTGQVRK